MLFKGIRDVALLSLILRELDKNGHESFRELRFDSVDT